MTAVDPDAAAPVGVRPHLVIRPRGRFAAVDVRELWTFRDVLRSFATRDVRLRYRQTALGVLWVVLQPLLAAGIFTFVFGKVAGLHSQGVPYLLFAFSGLLVWNSFSTVVTRCATSLTSAAAMISKIYFPRLLLPLSANWLALVDFGVGLLVEGVLLGVYGVNPGWHILTLPLWLLAMLLLGSGLGLVASAVSVRYRDVQFVLPIVVQMLLFVSPVGFAATSVPHAERWLVEVNPITGLLEAVRWSLLGRHAHLAAGQLAYSCIAAVMVMAVGALLFASLERDFADVI